MRNLARLFRSYCSEKHSRWALEMHKFADFLNLIVHESTGYRPVELQAENLTSIPSVVVKKIPYPKDSGQIPYERITRYCRGQNDESRAIRGVLTQLINLGTWFF